MRPTISVILPVFNGSTYLRDCIESVLAQTHRSFELLVLDDGSEDDSLEIIKSYDDPRIRLLRSGGHKGLYGCLNRLAKETSTKHFHILCQDDILEITCLEDELKFFKQYPDAGMSFCKGHRMRASGVFVHQGIVREEPRLLSPDISIQYMFYHGSSPAKLSSVCVSKEAWKAARGFDESFVASGDYELWARLAENAPVGIIPQALVRLRQHRGQFSRQRSFQLSYMAENRKVREKLVELLPPFARLSARKYEKNKHHVKDFQQAVEAVREARWDDVKSIYHVFGKKGFAKTMTRWALTLNNRINKPQPGWILAESPDEENPDEIVIRKAA